MRSIGHNGSVQQRDSLLPTAQHPERASSRAAKTAKDLANSRTIRRLRTSSSRVDGFAATRVL
jgi:hypothetical protein